MSRRVTATPQSVTVWLAAVLFVAMLATSGCLAGSSEPRRFEAIAADIGRALAEHPDVTEAEVGYYDYLTDPRTVKADLTVRPDADVEAVIDEAVRLIWLSEIASLSSLSVFISHPDDRVPRQTHRWSVRDPAGEDHEELVQRYGPRPAPG